MLSAGCTQEDKNVFFVRENLTGCGTQPSSYKIGTKGSFQGANTDLHSVPRLRMTGVELPLSLYALMASTG
jgi:hypothetical protein